MKFDQKKALGALLVGAGVLVGTPLISGLIAGIPFMDQALVAGLTVGGLLAAGVSAFAVTLAVEEWM